MKWKCGNAFDIMRKMDSDRERFDLVIMDPPPFSPAKGQVESARRGYKELAVRGFNRIKDGGHMVFLCAAMPFREKCCFRCSTMRRGMPVYRAASHLRSISLLTIRHFLLYLKQITLKVLFWG